MPESSEVSSLPLLSWVSSTTSCVTPSRSKRALVANQFRTAFSRRLSRAFDADVVIGQANNRGRQRSRLQCAVARRYPPPQPAFDRTDFCPRRTSTGIYCPPDDALYTKAKKKADDERWEAHLRDELERQRAIDPNVTAKNVENTKHLAVCTDKRLTVGARTTPEVF